MTLTELRYIVAVAQEQHFGRAAELCHVSQPTLSIAVKKLEEELGVVMFERGKQGVLTTPLGQRIVAMANQVLEQTARIRDVADADKDQLSGPLALGTLPTIGPYLLPQFIPLLHEMAPGLTLYVEEASQSALTAKLRAGELDAILVTAPFAESDVVAQPLFEEAFVVLMPGSHRLTAKSVIEADDLEPGQVLLLREGHAFRDQVLAAFPQLRTPRPDDDRTFVQGTTLETLRHMVASGLGITILPQTAAEAPLYAPNLLVTRPFAPPVPKRILLLAWRVSFPRHKAVDALRRAIQASSAAYWDFRTGQQAEGAGVLVENSDW